MASAGQRDGARPSPTRASSTPRRADRARPRQRDARGRRGPAVFCGLAERRAEEQDRPAHGWEPGSEVERQATDVAVGRCPLLGVGDRRADIGVIGVRRRSRWGRPISRAFQGGGVPATAAPSFSAAPEPPVGVIMRAGSSIGCEFGTSQLHVFSPRLSPSLSPELAPIRRPRPSSAVTLQGTRRSGRRGFGPTARSGHPADPDRSPSATAQLVAGIRHIRCVDH